MFSPGRFWSFLACSGLFWSVLVWSGLFWYVLVWSERGLNGADLVLEGYENGVSKVRAVGLAAFLKLYMYILSEEYVYPIHYIITF